MRKQGQFLLSTVRLSKRSVYPEKLTLPVALQSMRMRLI